MNSKVSKRNYAVYSILATVATAAAYFYSTGLHPQWYLTWLAPLPILFLAPRASRWTAWLAAFLAFAAGSLNMAVYYHTVAPVAVVALSVVGPAILFAFSVLAFRRLVLGGLLLRATFVLPALWVAYEYLSETFSPHSTFGNLAYTQMDNLPVLQLTALTGIWSISFLLFLFPSAIAALAAPQSAPPRQKCLVILVTLAIFTATLAYGELRLRSARQGPLVTVALIDSDPPTHTPIPKGSAATEVIHDYTEQIPILAAQGAQIVIIPEKTILLDSSVAGASNLAPIDNLLAQAARDNHLTVVVGVQHVPNLNESRIYAPDGGYVNRPEVTYEKHHMLPAFESDLLPGTLRTLIDRPSGKWGFTICKDMDFPELSREYGNDGAGLLLVPAWDFTVDGWLHGRMAILRGVESGFAIARSARTGILTVSDSRGRVLAEKTTGASRFDTLVAKVPIHAERTFYERFGDWFAWFDLALAGILLLWPVREITR
jgi:apolipoprotein N-acyltransferase